MCRETGRLRCAASPLSASGPERPAESVPRGEGGTRRSDAKPQLRAAAVDALLTAIRDGVLIVDAARGVVVVANDAAAEILGQTPGKSIPIADYSVRCGLFRPDGRLYSVEALGLDGAVIGAGEHSRREVMVRRPDGSCRQVLATTVPVAGTAGVVERVHVLHDVTKAREMEAWANDLLSAVAHDLKNPLTAIKGFTALILRKGEYHEGFLLSVKEQCDRLQRMIDDLTDEARLRMGRFTLNKSWVGVTLLASQAVDEARGEFPGFPILLSVPSDAPTAYWDGPRLRQALGVLLRRGIVSIRARGEALVTAQAEPECVHLRISCRPAATSADEKERAGRADEPAVSRVAEIDLRAARSIIRQHGGEVQAERRSDGAHAIAVILPRRG